ncbi:MAG: translocase [Yoonia sp.]|uniref:preprotein translocase subunit SecA n=1 Tax=Yoonia sp. TaxID=2212373 RepID=UPI003EFA5122
MSDRQVLRPGLLGGFYPERSDERATPLDQALAAGTGRLDRILAARPVTGRLFLRRVHRAAKKMEPMPDDMLRTERIRISQHLRLRGLTTKEVACAFALVQETAFRTLGMRHFDVQLLGGLVMLRGQIAEMQTGEGKTLTATLTAAVMALSGVPVHVITVNDFLAERDAEWMGKLYRELGLSVGVIIEDMTIEARRDAYACDITYCTNKQVVFDYLKDRLLLDRETRPLHMAIEGLSSDTPRRDKVMMRGLCFALVDEADSVLIDEARTPLIIAKQGDTSDLELTYERAIAVGRQMQGPRDFQVLEREWRVVLTDLGKAHLRRVTARFGGVWAAEAHREELATQALSALYLYKCDKHYLVSEDTIQIIDEYTGRVMADRSWERGLHQMIEVKEGCPISTRQETLIRISYQRFFRRYVQMAGMTGTAQEVAAELSKVYRLRTRPVRTNRRSRRRDLGQVCYANTDYKWKAVLRNVRKLHALGRPVLIGTQSVNASEQFSAILTDAGLTHRVLNARQNHEEAEVIAQAGTHGRITVATNMAGRGTDIELDAIARQNGGLHVISTGRHDAGRIDRQLYGRAARQGDPGSHITFIALDDDLMRVFYGGGLGWISRLTGWGRGWVPGVIARPLMAIAQYAGERRHSKIRKALLKADENMEDLLAFSGRHE